jgi:hypothetical protein
MFRDGESRGIAASSPTAGWPSTSVRSVSAGTAGNGLVTGGGGAVAVPDPAENEIEPPALYPPFGGGPSVTGFGGGAASFNEMRRRRASTVPVPSAMASTTTTAMTIQIQVGTGQS